MFLGAPDGDTALAVLPGHRLLLEGAGAEAVRLSALGSAGSVVVSMLFVLPFSLFFGAVYPYLQEYMEWVLLSIVFIMLASEKGEEVKGQGSLAKYRYKAYALLLFLTTGVLGLFAFSRENILLPVISLGQASVLLPLLSGLFGASQLIISLLTKSEIPAESVSNRITSYNVCYTKLLRLIAASTSSWMCPNRTRPTISFPWHMSTAPRKRSFK